MNLVYKRDKTDIQEESKIFKGYNKEEPNDIKKLKKKKYFILK